MTATLISHTCPIDQDKESLINQIAYCARVSNPGNQRNDDTAERLVRYMIKHKHWSPFEMVSLCIQIDTTRDIARQILRHRSFSFQEFSQRYADPTKSGFHVRESRLQDQANRQNSVETDDRELNNMWGERQVQVAAAAKSAYDWALLNGIAKEQARVILPEGMTPSTLYMNGTLRSWMHYIDLRSESSTQKEHRQVALDCSKAIHQVFPMIEEFTHAGEPQ